MALGPESVRLDGRVALVTGAAMGIGHAVALTLARFGADVAICDRDSGGLEATGRDVESLGRRAVTGVLDVRDAGRVHEFCETVREEFGRVDVLVNNAGGGFQARFLDITANGQDALVRENFSSVTHFVREVVPLMPAEGGSIINITSIEAHRAAPGYSVYSAMKAAVANLTRTLAVELAERMIRVNCIAPDVIPTPGVGDAPMAAVLPSGGVVDDVAGAAVFLAGDLSRFVTGTTVHVDGGNLAAGGWKWQDDGTFSP